MVGEGLREMWMVGNEGREEIAALDAAISGFMEGKIGWWDSLGGVGQAT